jgi:hypothetical protein
MLFATNSASTVTIRQLTLQMGMHTVQFFDNELEGWTLVRESLPKGDMLGTQIIICQVMLHKSSREIRPRVQVITFAAYYWNKKFKLITGGIIKNQKNIIAWRPLPDPIKVTLCDHL